MGRRKKHTGYVTDVITDLSLDFLKNRPKDKPFFLMCHHKAPHRPWEPDEKHAKQWENVEIPEPETFNDDYAHALRRGPRGDHAHRPRPDADRPQAEAARRA